MKKNNNVNTYAVYYLSDSGKSPKDIGKELGLTTKVVNDILSERVVEKNSAIKTTSSKITSKDLMIRETAGKGTKSVAIMTKAASEINDAFRQSIDDTIKSRTSRNAIYRPNSGK
jgi:hypothetical protein